MFLKILQAYDELGYKVAIGNNTVFCSSISKNGNLLHTGFGISITDIAFFREISNLSSFNKLFIIGNAYGYSTFVLAEIFSKALIDVIDAEVEGAENKLGSKITKIIAEKYYQNVNLTIGFSPEDLAKSMRTNKYNLVFIDGLHTNAQLIKDFEGMLPFCDDNCLVYLHDVGVANMHNAYDFIKRKHTSLSYYDIDFSNFGCKAAIKGYPVVQDWLTRIKPPSFISNGDNYSIGLRGNLKFDYTKQLKFM